MCIYTREYWLYSRKNSKSRYSLSKSVGASTRKEDCSDVINFIRCHSPEESKESLFLSLKNHQTTITSFEIFFKDSEGL